MSASENIPAVVFSWLNVQVVVDNYNPSTSCRQDNGYYQVKVKLIMLIKDKGGASGPQVVCMVQIEDYENTVGLPSAYCMQQGCGTMALTADFVLFFKFGKRKRCFSMYWRKIWHVD